MVQTIENMKENIKHLHKLNNEVMQDLLSMEELTPMQSQALNETKRGDKELKEFLQQDDEYIRKHYGKMIRKHQP